MVTLPLTIMFQARRKSNNLWLSLFHFEEHPWKLHPKTSTSVSLDRFMSLGSVLLVAGHIATLNKILDFFFSKEEKNGYKEAAISDCYSL